MKKILIYITLIIMVLGGCKKVDLPAPVVGDPVFSVDATIDSMSLDWTAGDGDVYMFTEFSKDALDIYTLTGRFAKDDNCTSDCEEYLSFSIRGNEATPTVNDFNINEVLNVNVDYSYAQNDSLSTMSGYKYSFEANLIDTFFNTQADSFLWIISTDSNYVFTGKEIQFNHFGNEDLEIQLEILTQNGCVTILKRTIPNGQASNCNLEIEVLDLNGVYSLSPFWTAGPITPGTYSWNGGASQDTFFLSPNLISSSLNLLASAPNFLCEVEMDICLNVDSFILNGISFPQFNYQFEDTTSMNSMEQFSNVVIEYFSDGTLYSSELGNNSNTFNNTFTISEIDNFEDNEYGEKTKKFRVDYDCNLADSLGNEKRIIGTSVLAVAYPN